MKIDATINPTVRTSATMPMAIQYRTGDVVVVQAVQAVNSSESASELLLKFPSGEQLYASLSEDCSKKPGDYFTIRIQSFDGKRIYAKVLPDSELHAIPKNQVNSLLNQLGIADTAENNERALIMLRMGLNLTKTNFDQIEELKKRHTSSTIEQLVFMLKNKLPVDKQTLSIAEALIAHQSNLGNELLLLFHQILGKELNDKLKSMLRMFYKNPADQNFGFEDIKNEGTIKDLIEILQALRDYVGKELRAQQKITDFLEKTIMQYELSKQIKPFTYIQIPIFLNGNYDVAEFYSLKQSKSEADEQRYIYLRIPTNNLGVVELLMGIYHDRSIQCHFKFENDDNPVGKRITVFYDMVKELGFRLTKVTYNQLFQDITIENFEQQVELISGNKKFDTKV